MKTPTIEEINSDLKRFKLPNFIKNRYPEFYEYLTNTYPFCKKITEAMWLYYHGMIDRPKCVNCGNPVRFNNWTDGYLTYCSQKCMSQQTRSKAKETMIEKYGGVGMGAPEIKSKSKETMIEKYGGIGFASPTISKKIAESNLEKYGTTHPTKSKIIQEKITSTMLKRYGVEHALQNDEFLIKSRETLKSHYGVDYPMKAKEIKDKNKASNRITREVYNEEITAKINATNMKKYGRKWGFDYDKVKQTNLERYGCENPLIHKCANGEIKFQGYSKSSQEFFNAIDEYLKDMYTTQYATKNGEKLIRIDNKNYYLDYFIEELNIAIEFNGDAWHGNPSQFKPDDHCFPMDNNITAKDLWEIDKIRHDRIKSQGIDIVVVWESDIKKIKDIQAWIHKYIIKDRVIL